MRLRNKVLLVMAGVLVGAPVFHFGVLYAKIWWDNANYAKRVFGGRVAFEHVLASRRWFFSGIGCSYAVVELSANAASEPPARTGSEHGKQHDSFESFGGDWRPTPGPDFGEPKSDGPWIFCRMALGKEVFDDLNKAMTTAGGWWIKEREDVIQVYSPTTKLAFRLYEGD